VHGLVAAALAIALSLRPALGIAYLIPAALASSALVWRGMQLVMEPSNRRAWLFFHMSNLFVAAAVLVVACAATLLPFQ
jgi:heme O synthase-like polyprenyltransferase